PLAVIAIIVMNEFRLDALTYPLNSLLGVRSTMPLFVAAHLLMRSTSRRADVERDVLLGLALVLGTEQGFAAIAALALSRGAMAITQGEWRRHLTHFAAEAGAAVAYFMVLIALLAEPHLPSVLRFNF